MLFTLHVGRRQWPGQGGGAATACCAQHARHAPEHLHSIDHPMTTALLSVSDKTGILDLASALRTRLSPRR